jgi:para-aminobenzoate synthetase component 1
MAPDWQARARGLLTGGGERELPFSGGLVGWLGYEAGRTVERMPEPVAPRPLADLKLWRTEGGLCLDRRTGQWHIGGSPAFREAAAATLNQARAPLPVPRLAAPRLPPPGMAERYQSGVASILEAITAGEVYQACLAWEHIVPAMADPIGAWLALRADNPARRGALLRSGDALILSNSPELFLAVERRDDRLIALSVPIKGTVRRAEGSEGRLALWESEKERAELTMIVDLVRNDLGRVALPGTVRTGCRRLRRCGDLLHAEQPVTATLEPGRDALDAVTAAFPPGSVTGAPKVAAMALIGALEAGPRGVYTGGIGYFCDDGRAHLSVAIRTTTVASGQCRFHVGAGIVADSDPRREWAETLAKGVAMGRWMGAE